MSCFPLYLIFVTPDHVILKFPIEFDEVRAPSPDPDDQPLVFLRVDLGVEEGFSAHGVQLELVPAPPDEEAYELGDFRAVFRLREDPRVEFEGQGAAVADLFRSGSV